MHRPTPSHMSTPNPVVEEYEKMLRSWPLNDYQLNKTTKDAFNIRSWDIELSRLEPLIIKEHKMGMLNWWTQKKELEIEVKRLTSIIDIERKKLQAEYDILATRKSMELAEHEKLYRMEMKNELEKQKMQMEDKLSKQATLYNESLQKLAAVHAQQQSAIETKLAKEYYEKMTEALREVNLEGSFQAKSLQELSMTMFAKVLEKPMPSHIIQERIGS